MTADLRAAGGSHAQARQTSSGPYQLRKYDLQPAFDRDSPAATTERVVIRKTDIPLVVYASDLTVGQIESNRELRGEPLAVRHDDEDVPLRFVEIEQQRRHG